VKRIDYDNSIGDNVYHIKYGVKRKQLDLKMTGPFRITDVYTNGCVGITDGVKNLRVYVHSMTRFVLGSNK